MNGGFTIEIKTSAQKEMDSLSETVFARIDKKIITLARNPRPQGCRKLRGQKDVWRIRIGDYRVLYSIDETRNLVTSCALLTAGSLRVRDSFIKAVPLAHWVFRSALRRSRSRAGKSERSLNPRPGCG